MSSIVYLDYNATTPVDPRVLDTMLPYFTQHYGNPSSEAHSYGWTANAAVALARRKVAECLGAPRPSEITFTSGSTEGINAALKGVMKGCAHKGRHLVTMQTEHSAVRRTCKYLEQQGCRVTYLGVDRDGLINLDELDAALTSKTVLVCVMWANNETGVVQPVAEIAQRAHAAGAFFMTDATQAVGKVPVSVEHADILVCSGHKIYGPKGVGAMFIRERVRRSPLIAGGGQERGYRGGTLNVPGIVGMGEALHLAMVEREKDEAHLSSLRDELETGLCRAVAGVYINGRAAPRLPQTSSVTFPDVPIEQLLMELRTLAVSTGSACSSSAGSASPVLRAMGLSPQHASRTLRISLGRFTSRGDVEAATQSLISAAHSLIPASA